MFINWEFLDCGSSLVEPNIQRGLHSPWPASTQILSARKSESLFGIGKVSKAGNIGTHRVRKTPFFSQLY